MSGDKTQDKFDSYFATQPWLAVARGADVVKTTAQKFNVRGVPRVVMLNAATGEVVDSDCLKKLENEGPMAIEAYKEMI